MPVIDEFVRTTEIADLVRDERIHAHVRNCELCRFVIDDDDDNGDYVSYLRVIKYGEIRVVPVEIDVDHVNVTGWGK